MKPTGGRKIFDLRPSFTARPETRMKLALEVLSETFTAAAAILWFMSARVRLRKRSLATRGQGTDLDDPRLLLRLVYEQSQWSAWAAIAPGLAAIFAIADGLARYVRSPPRRPLG